MENRSLTKQRLHALDVLMNSTDDPMRYNPEYVFLLKSLIKLGQLEEKIKQKVPVILGGEG